MSDDWKPLPPDSFVSKLSSGPAPDPLILNVDLERRLLEAQQEGLEANVRRQHKFLGSPSLIELQILGVRKGNSVYESSFAAHALSVDDAVRLTSEVDRWSAHGIYILCAQLKPGVETRQSAPGKWFEVPKSSGTKDTDVDVRLILSIDFDVHRPTSISTTNEELERSIRTSLSGWSYLSGSIGSEDCLAYVHSGNGRQIHIALDMLPNDDEVKNICAGILVGMGSLFDSDTIKVDQKLFDAKRILPACGTVKKKGASGIPERPHRRTAIVLGSPEPSDADESYGSVTIRRLSLDNLKDLARQIWNDTDDEGRAAMSKAMGIKPAAPPQTVSQLTPSSDSPFARANAVAPGDVAMWLGVYDGTTPICPGCGESKGVAVLNHGFKCSHNRCQSRGRNGFRTNVDLVAEVRGVAPRDAVNALAEKFGFEGLGAGVPEPSFAPMGTPGTTSFKLQKLDELLAPSIARARRRKSGEERPVPLPWKSLLGHFGGGLWPGVHFLCAGTGIGKTTLGLQIASYAAFAGIPAGYIGLELEHFQFAMRMMGEQAKVKWSHVYTGQAHSNDISRMESSIPALTGLPFYLEVGRPQAWPVSELGRMGQAIRDAHPETFPGSSPFLMVVDFLQLVGDETNTRPSELRERIGRAAYYARDVAARLNAAVLVISSIARDKYDILSSGQNKGGIKFTADASGRPMSRRILNPDALVGLGKESGDIEFSGDSVSAIFRAPNPLPSGQGEAMLFVTAKGRATGASWSPMYFTGFRYEEPIDEGRAIALGLQGAQAAKAEKQKAKADRKTEDAVAVVRYVLAHPGCGVGEVRKTVVSDDGPRWTAASSRIGSALTGLSGGKGKRAALGIDVTRLDPTIREHLGEIYGEAQTDSPRDLGPGEEKPCKGSPQARSPQASQIETLGSPQGAEPVTWKVAADVSVLVGVRQRGDDPAAWATEEGWDDERIRVAVSALPAQPPEPAPTETPDPARRRAPPTREHTPKHEKDAWALAALGDDEDKAVWAKEQGWSDERFKKAIEYLTRDTSAPPAPKERQRSAGGRGRPDPAYVDLEVLEANATALFDVLEDGVTARQIETSPKSCWTPADIEVLLKHLLADGRLVELDGKYFKGDNRG